MKPSQRRLMDCRQMRASRLFRKGLIRSRGRRRPLGRRNARFRSFRMAAYSSAIEPQFSNCVYSSRGVTMPIKVVKVTQAMYIAEATPPHSNAPWSTSQPMRFHELCEQLLNRGGHQTDVADAVDSADREWEEKMIEERRNR